MISNCHVRFLGERDTATHALLPDWIQIMDEHAEDEQWLQVMD
jgi:hypothetical protein